MSWTKVSGRTSGCMSTRRTLEAHSFVRSSAISWKEYNTHNRLHSTLPSGYSFTSTALLCGQPRWRHFCTSFINVLLVISCMIVKGWRTVERCTELSIFNLFTCVTKTQVCSLKLLFKLVNYFIEQFLQKWNLLLQEPQSTTWSAFYKIMTTNFEKL